MRTRLGWYQTFALVTLNTLLLVLGLNLVLAAAFAIRDSWRKPAGERRISRYRETYIDRQAYQRMPAAEVEAYFDEEDRMMSQGFDYVPWVQFRYPHFEGRFLHTDRSGFRRTTPAPPSGSAPKVYVFGGSTAFGYGVSDEHTLPSYLQKLANGSGVQLTVSNLAEGFYYSSQELALLSILLRRGDLPRCAVFLDGLNDTIQLAGGQDEPKFTFELRQLWEARAKGQPLGQPGPLARVPMIRFANGLASRWRPQPAGLADQPPADPGFVVRTYLENQKMIDSLCRSYGVNCRFVWQPVPFHAYDRSWHRHFPFDGEIPKHWAAIYEQMRRHTGPHYLYLGDLFASTRDKVYVDSFHYNERANEQIAAKILDFLKTSEALRAP